MILHFHFSFGSDKRVNSQTVSQVEEPKSAIRSSHVISPPHPIHRITVFVRSDFLGYQRRSPPKGMSEQRQNHNSDDHFCPYLFCSWIVDSVQLVHVHLCLVIHRDGIVVDLVVGWLLPATALLQSQSVSQAGRSAILQWMFRRRLYPIRKDIRFKVGWLARKDDQRILLFHIPLFRHLLSVSGGSWKREWEKVIERDGKRNSSLSFAVNLRSLLGIGFV